MKMRVLSVWLSLALTLYPVAFSPLAAADDTKADTRNPPLVLRSTTRLVQLNVIATRGSQPANGLKKEDFVITDNGKPQSIAVFSENSSAPLPAAATPLPANTFTNRLEQKSGTPASITVILLDNLNTRWTDQAFARRQVVKFLQQIQPGDHIGIYALGSSLKVLHDYTADSSELLHRLASYKGGNLPDLQGGEAMKGMDGDTLMLDTWLRGAGASGIERDFYTRDRSLGTLKALEFIADHLSRVPGRKSLIWVSGGFPLMIGYDSVAAWHNPTRLQETFSDEVDRTVRALNNADLSIYPVDARGLMVDHSFDTSRHGSANPRRMSMPKAPPGSKNQATMEELASRTGGKAFYNTNDITKAVASAVADARLTYTLGYYPADEKFDGKFHKIEVHLKKGGVKLRYRKGYFDMPEQPQDTVARKTELRDAVFSPLDATELGLTVRVAPYAPKPGSYEVLVKVEPSGIGLQQAGDRWDGKLDVLLIQKDAQGRQYNGQDDTIEMQLKQEKYAQVSKEGLTYRQVIEKNGRATQLRIVVRDAASGSMGSVTVPFGELKG
jgi:VWFA-related protein